MREKFSLIVTIVNNGFSDYVIDSTRRSGASGGTVLKGRGTGDLEMENFLGIVIHPEKELVLTVVKEKEKDKIIKAIADDLSLDAEHRGFCFSIPINNIAGVAHLISYVEKKEEK